MKFEVIKRETGMVLDIDETSQMSIDTDGRLCGNDSFSGLFELDKREYATRFPEHEALKVELGKWQKFYAALPKYFVPIDGPARLYACHIQTENIARECRIEIEGV